MKLKDIKNIKEHIKEQINPFEGKGLIIILFLIFTFCYIIYLWIGGK